MYATREKYVYDSSGSNDGDVFLVMFFETESFILLGYMRILVSKEQGTRFEPSSMQEWDYAILLTDCDDSCRSI